MTTWKDERLTGRSKLERNEKCLCVQRREKADRETPLAPAATCTCTCTFCLLPLLLLHLHFRHLLHLFHHRQILLLSFQLPVYKYAGLNTSFVSFDDTMDPCEETGFVVKKFTLSWLHLSTKKRTKDAHTHTRYTVHSTQYIPSTSSCDCKTLRVNWVYLLSHLFISKVNCAIIHFIQANAFELSIDFFLLRPLLQQQSWNKKQSEHASCLKCSVHLQVALRLCSSLGHCKLYL